MTNMCSKKVETRALLGGIQQDFYRDD